jgi:hypothetical protein
MAAGAKTYVIGGAQTAVGKVNDTLQVILTIAIVIVVGLIIWNVVKGLKAGGKLVGDAIGGAITAQQTGISVPRQNFIRSLVADIESHVTRVPLTGWKLWVSDEGVTESLNKLVSAPEAKLLSEYYKQATGESLRSEIVYGGYFTAESRKKINTVILNAIT